MFFHTMSVLLETSLQLEFKPDKNMWLETLSENFKDEVLKDLTKFFNYIKKVIRV